MVLLVGVDVVGPGLVPLERRHGAQEVDAGVEHPQPRLLGPVRGGVSSMSRSFCQPATRSLFAGAKVSAWFASAAAFLISA